MHPKQTNQKKTGYFQTFIFKLLIINFVKATDKGHSSLIIIKFRQFVSWDDNVFNAFFRNDSQVRNASTYIVSSHSQSQGWKTVHLSVNNKHLNPY